MATERVGIEINLMGYEEARSQMENLDRMVKGLNGRRGYLRIKARVDELRMNKKALQAARVKVQADITDVDHKIQRIRDRIRRLNAAKTRFNMDEAGIRKADARIQELRERLASLGRQKTGLRDEFRQINNEIGQTTSELGRMQDAMRNAGLAGKSLKQVFKGTSTATAHIGSAMQSLGNAMTRLSYPIRMFTSGAIMGAGFAAMNKVTEGLKSGFERYDIMNKYPKMMAQFETATFSAQDSIDKLDTSVRGLPTGLDEMVNLAQRFTMTIGDMEKGTDLAIATNNAFLASMSTDTQRYQGMMQLQDVLGGKKMTSKEWQSLANSMMPAIRMMGEELGKSGKELDEWVSSVQQGKISNEEFLDALIKTGTGAGKAAKMAELSKDTWEAFSANVTNAFSRMGAGVIKSLDEVVKIATGGEYDKLNRLLSDKVGPGIDSVAESVKGWIKANPEKIIGFFDSLKSIDWKGLGLGFVKGMGNIAKGIKWIADKFGGRGLETIGKLAAYIGPLGSILTIGGGLIKGGRPIWGALAAGIVGIGRVFTAIGGVMAGGIAAKGISGIGKFMTAVGKLGKAEKGMSKLGSFVKTFGKVAPWLSKASTASAGLKPGMILKGMLPAFEIVTGVGGLLTEVSGIAFLDTYLIKKAVGNVKAITDGMKGVFDSVDKLKGQEFDKDSLRDAVNNVFSMYDIIYGETESKRAVGKTIQTQRSATGLNSMKKKALADMADSMKSMNSVFTYMNAMRKNLDKLQSAGEFDETAVDAVNSFVQGLGTIYEEMKTSFEDNIDANTAKNVSEMVENSKGVFTSMGEIAKTIPSLSKQLAKVMKSGGVAGMGHSPLSQVREYLAGENGVFASIHDIYEAINTQLLGLDGEAGGQSFNADAVERLSGVMDNVKTMFTSISEFVGLLPELQSGLTPMMNGGASPGSGANMFTVLKTQINQMMKGIGEIVATIDTEIGDTGNIEAKMSGLVNSVTHIQEVATKLSSLGSGEMASTGTASFTAIENIKNMVTQLGQALNTETIGALQMQVAQFKASVDQIFETLNGDLANVEVEVHIDGKVTGHDKLISDINEAKKKIRSAVLSIPNRFVRHVYIQVTPHVSVGSFKVPTAADLGGNDYRGGLITGKNGMALYRSKGGSILGQVFKPKGTDTVPAMLTPGEYVHRKKAVDTFGVRFMQKVNQLDVAGAFREMSARFGGIVTNNSGTYITNNITNNNSPTINQNINTNNPNFAFKRSNRYVMAL